VATPYPGTELFHAGPGSLITDDYRLFDIQHAVLETRLELERFYELLVETQMILNRKFMGWRTALALSRVLAGQLLRGQTNFLRSLFRFSGVYNAGRQYGDHLVRPRYRMSPPRSCDGPPDIRDLMIHAQAPPGCRPVSGSRNGPC
jgi:magnesium-protoporphyrin IX monomethyl ester (oxidative) cyclase